MKTLTIEVAQEIAAQSSDIQDFIKRLDAANYIGEPKLSLTKRQIVEILEQEDRVRTEVNSTYILLRLVKAGYLYREKDDKAVNVGRRPYLYLLTPKGKSLINLSKNWGVKKTENA